MRLRLIRHATFLIVYNGRTLLLDPMLDDVGARAAIENSPNPRNNPLVPLPMSAEALVPGVDAVLVTHTHSDHWDTKAGRLLPQNLPLFGQPEDEAQFRSLGFTQVETIGQPMRWNGIEITPTGAQHGTGEIARMLAPVSGFVLRAAGEPVLYIAGDTIWCPEVEEALGKYQPAVTVVNAGGARFLEGDPITMTAEDVIAVCRRAHATQVIACHMEAINHCLLSRTDLAFQLEAARVAGQVAIPQDGEWVELR
jgi:L-ascorbate metabolism protein UlaG (beta-lactamase superfamily)